MRQSIRDVIHDMRDLCGCERPCVTLRGLVCIVAGGKGGDRWPLESGRLSLALAVLRDTQVGRSTLHIEQLVLECVCQSTVRSRAAWLGSLVVVRARGAGDYRHFEFDSGNAAVCRLWGTRAVPRL